MTAGKIIEIEKLIPGGKGLGHIDGKAVFVPYVLPGEKVEIRVREDKKSYIEADLIQVLEDSAERIQPFCPLFGICGGCNLQHMKYSAQLAVKKEFALNLLQRNGGILRDNIEIESSVPLGYRNRVQVHYAGPVRGFRERSGAGVVKVDSCPVAVRGVNSFLREKEGAYYEDRVTVFATDDWYSPATEKKDIDIEILNRKISFNSSLFFQSNLSMLPSLGLYLRENVLGDKLLDLYSGVGLLSSLVQDLFVQIEAVELNGRVAPYIERNLQVKHRFHPLSLEKWVEKSGRKCTTDTIIIDPPRTGLTKPVRKYLCKSGAARIIYLSCDPATMARDLKDLLADNYAMADFKVLDFYPQTSHMEAVALLDRV